MDGVRSSPRQNKEVPPVTLEQQQAVEVLERRNTRGGRLLQVVRPPRVRGAARGPQHRCRRGRAIDAAEERFV